VKGRWAAGIVPRNFSWIVMERLAVSERPGGYAPHHRKVRRQEEILWLSAQRFTRVVSLLPSAHNLHSYEELGIKASHFSLSGSADGREVLSELYPALLGWLRHGERVLIHQEELGERIAGVIAGFLCWSGLLPEPPQAISIVEQLLRRQMGATGREIVAISLELPVPVDERGVPLPPRPLSGGFAFLASPPRTGGGMLRVNDTKRASRDAVGGPMPRNGARDLVVLHPRANAKGAVLKRAQEVVAKPSAKKERVKAPAAKASSKSLAAKMETRHGNTSVATSRAKKLSAKKTGPKIASKVAPKAPAKRPSAKTAGPPPKKGPARRR